MIGNIDYLSLKSEYPYLYALKFDKNLSVVFRLLNWGEYQSIISLTKFSHFDNFSTDIEDEIFLKCVIDCSYSDFKENIDILPAGLIYTTVQMIMMLSGASDPARLINDLAGKRAIVKTVYEQMYMVLGSIFHMDKEKINSMYYPDILEYIAFGEQIMAGELPAVPFTIDSESKGKINFDEENKELLRD